MNLAVYAIFGFAALAISYAFLAVLAPAYLKQRGARRVTCPETKQPVVVEVNARRAALSRGRNLRLQQCTRWPEKRNCGQECLREVQAAPQGCLVRHDLTRWYAGKSCVLCGKPFGEITWMRHKPCLLSPDGEALEWHEIDAVQLPDVLATYKPICWSCHIAEAFREEFPELVVDRRR